MLTPDYLDACTDDIVELTDAFQSCVLEDMARRFVRMGSLSEATVDQAELLQQSGLLRTDVASRLAALTPNSEAEIAELFGDAAVRALEYDDSVYKSAGLNPLPLKGSPALLSLLTADARKTNRNLKNLTMTTAVSTQSAFIQSVNLAQMQVSAGAMDLNRAVGTALKTLGRQGVEVIYYPGKGGRAGHRDKVDIAVRRAVLTGVNQTAAALQLLRMDEMEWDLVETTAHMGARPSHAEWQGLVFSRSGRRGQYEDFVTATGYGSGGGLCGWNCRHNFFPYFPGFSPRTHSRKELADMESRTVTVNGGKMTLYDAGQKQRKQEREIRALKRELVTLRAGIDAAPDEALARALQNDFDLTALTLKTKETEIASFARQAGLVRQREREQARGFGVSTAQRAVQAAKRTASKGD